MALLQMHSDPRVSAKATTLLQTYFVAQAGPALAMAEQWKDERKQRFESIVPQKPLAEALYQSKARAVMSVQKIANQCLDCLLVLRNLNSPTEMPVIPVSFTALVMVVPTATCYCVNSVPLCSYLHGPSSPCSRFSFG